MFVASAVPDHVDGVIVAVHNDPTNSYVTAMDRIPGEREVFAVARETRARIVDPGKLLRSIPGTTVVQFRRSVHTSKRAEVSAGAVNDALNRRQAKTGSEGTKTIDSTQPPLEYFAYSRAMSSSAGVRLLFEVWRRTRNCRYLSYGDPIGPGTVWRRQAFHVRSRVFGVEPDRVSTETLVSLSVC